MNRLSYLLSFLLFANVCASDSTVVEKELVSDKEAADKIVCLLDEIRPQLEQPENYELKELFDKALKSIKGVSSRKVKEHDRRALKKAIETLNDSLLEQSNDELTRSFPTKDELLEKMQKLNTALYAVLQNSGKKLNETKLDDILDLIYHRPKEFVQEYKKEVLITSSVVTAIILLYLGYKYFKSGTPDAATEEDDALTLGEGMLSREGEGNRHLPSKSTCYLKPSLDHSEKYMENLIKRKQVKGNRFAKLTFTHLGINKKAENKLREAGIESVEDLADKSMGEISKLNGIGKITLEEIEKGFESIFYGQNPEETANVIEVE